MATAVVIICGTEYPTITAASAALHISIDTIRMRLKSKVEHWSDWIRKGNPKQTRRSHKSREVVVNGISFPSVHLAAQSTGLTYNTVYGRCESTAAEYSCYRFVDNIQTRCRQRFKGIVVIVDGCSYDTLSAAAKVKGIHSMTLSRKMGQPRYPTYYYADRKTGQRIKHKETQHENNQRSTLLDQSVSSVG